MQMRANPGALGCAVDFSALLGWADPQLAAGRSPVLVLTRKSNQSIMIGDDIEVSVLSIMGEKVRIGIQAPRDIPVFRKEVYLEIQEERGRDLAGPPCATRSTRPCATSARRRAAPSRTSPGEGAQASSPKGSRSARDYPMTKYSVWNIATVTRTAVPEEHEDEQRRSAASRACGRARGGAGARRSSASRKARSRRRRSASASSTKARSSEWRLCRMRCGAAMAARPGYPKSAVTSRRARAPARPGAPRRPAARSPRDARRWAGSSACGRSRRGPAPR